MRSTLALLWCLSSSAFLAAQAYSGHQRWVYVNGQIRYKANTAYCLSVAQGQERDGARIQLHHCAKDDTFSTYYWDFDGKYIRYKKNPSYCLSVPQGDARDGKPLYLWSCGEAKEYQWRMDGEHIKYEADQRLWVSLSENKIADSTDIILWSGHGNGFRWIMEGDRIKLKVQPDLCVSVRPNSKNSKSFAGQGSEFILWTCGPSDSPGQGYQLDPPGHLRSKTNPANCLAVKDNDYKDGAHVVLWPCTDHESMLWEKSGEHIRWKKYNDYCLSVEEEKAMTRTHRTGEGSRLVLWHCDSPDAEDKEGLTVHHQSISHDIEKNVGQWKIGTDGGIRSFIDPRYCLSISKGEVRDGGAILMWHCGMNEKNSEASGSQKWIVENTLIKLKQNPEYCLSVRAGNEFDGAQVILWSCGWSNAYRFNIEGNSIKYRADPKFQVAVQGREMFDGSEVFLWSGYANPFLWVFHEEHIKLKVDPKYCLTMRDGKMKHGSDLILWECGTHDEFLWTIVGDHIIPSFDGGSGLCVGLKDGRHHDNTALQLQTCHDEDITQKWVVMGERVRSKEHRDYCMSVSNGKIGDGSNLVLVSCDERLDSGDDEL